MQRWLARLRHDLVKPVAWIARDLVASGGAAAPDALALLRRTAVSLRDDVGCTVDLVALWRTLRTEAPAAPRAALDAFEARVVAAAATAAGDDPSAALVAALAVETAFGELEHALTPPEP